MTPCFGVPAAEHAGPPWSYSHQSPPTWGPSAVSQLGQQAVPRLGRIQHPKVVPRRRSGINQRESVQRSCLTFHRAWRGISRKERFLKQSLRWGDLSQNGIAILATISTTHYLLSTSSKQRNNKLNKCSKLSIFHIDWCSKLGPS